MHRLLPGVAIVLAAATLNAQLPASAHVAGVGNIVLTVGDLERSRAFYRDTLGIPLEGSTAIVPGAPMGIELAPAAAGGRVLRRGLQDPGAARLILTVRDIDAALIQARFSGATVLSEGDAVVPMSDERGRARAVLVQDPDGFFVQLMQRDGPVPADAPASNVMAATVGLTVDDMDRTMRIFRDVLGFELKRDPEDNDNARLAMMGVFTAFYRRVIATVPGTSVELELIEIHGLNRRQVSPTLGDAGSLTLTLRATDVGRALGALAAADVRVAAADTAIASTPDRFFLQLVAGR